MDSTSPLQRKRLFEVLALPEIGEDQALIPPLGFR